MQRPTRLGYAGRDAARPASPLDRWGYLLATWVAVAVGTVAWFARESLAVVLATLLVDGGAAALWAASAGLGGATLLRRLRATARPTLFAATAAGLGMGIWSLAILGLGLAGWLNFWTAAALPVVSILLFTIDLALAPPAWARRLRATGQIDLGLSRPAGGAWGLLPTAVPFAFAATGAAFTPGVLWKPDDPHPYDVLSYHLQVPREWHDVGRIVPLDHNIYAYFPFGAEVHALAAMHVRGGPWAGMFQAQCLSLVCATLATAAICGASRRPLGGAVGAAAFAAVPWTIMLSAVAYNEAMLLLFTALTVAWGLRWLRRPMWRAAAVAGAMAGFAAGVKYPAVPLLFFGWPAAVALAAWVTRGGSSGSRSRAAKPQAARQDPRGSSEKPLAASQRWSGLHRLAPHLVVYGLTATAIFAPWLARNVAWVGNPVYPLAMGLLGRGDLSDEQVERWEAAHAAPVGRASWRDRTAALGREVIGNWQYGYVGWPLAAGSAVVVLVTAGRRKQREAVALVAYVGAVAVVWVAFTHQIGRFVVPAIPAAAMLIGAAAAGRARWVVVAGVGLMVLTGVAGVGPRLGVAAERLGRQGFFGATDLSFMLPDGLSDPADAGRPIVLVGDAGAFWYQLPAGRLRYRSVFDVEAGEPSAVRAWLGPDAERAFFAGDRRRRPILVVNPVEVRRLHETYRHVPPLDAGLPGPADRTFLVR